MTCPICGHEDYEVIKIKGKKKKDLLVKCDQCSHVYHEYVDDDVRPINVRVVISEFEKSWRSEIELFSDEYLEVGTLLYIDDKDVEVTSIENTESHRVDECPVEDILTIWAKSLDTLARIGLSIDYKGDVLSHKLEIEKDFIFTIGDVCQVNTEKFQIYAFKTLERNMRKGYAYAKVIKRIYGKLLPLSDTSKVQYDLSDYVIKTTVKDDYRYY